MTIIEWKQHHAFAMMVEMLNDKKKSISNNAAQ
jgi:hypothetical protein